MLCFLYSVWEDEIKKNMKKMFFYFFSIIFTIIQPNTLTLKCIRKIAAIRAILLTVKTVRVEMASSKYLDVIADISCRLTINQYIHQIKAKLGHELRQCDIYSQFVFFRSETLHIIHENRNSPYMFYFL